MNEQEKLTPRAVRVQETIAAMTIGHIDAILSRKDALLALRPEELDQLAPILEATKAAGNGCCTGG